MSIGDDVQDQREQDGSYNKQCDRGSRPGIRNRCTIQITFALSHLELIASIEACSHEQSQYGWLHPKP